MQIVRNTFLYFLANMMAMAVSLAMIPIAIVLGAAYYALFWGLQGATPGKRALGLAVAAEDGTTPIGMSRATLRVTWTTAWSASYCAAGKLGPQRRT